MAINRQPVLKRCKTLGIAPIQLGVTKKVRESGKKNAGGPQKKLSEYGVQLREKQKAKMYYNILEKQFKLCFKNAEKMPGITGENLLILLERRLDNVIYRLGFARTRREARQIVSHNHVQVNGKKVNIASYKVKAGDTVEIREKAKDSQRYKDVLDRTASITVPAWLSVDHDKLSGTIVSIPTREQIDTQINETLIVELYSK